MSTIRWNKTIAITGKTGIGKTTEVRRLLNEVNEEEGRSNLYDIQVFGSNELVEGGYVEEESYIESLEALEIETSELLQVYLRRKLQLEGKSYEEEQELKSKWHTEVLVIDSIDLIYTLIQNRQADEDDRVRATFILMNLKEIFYGDYDTKLRLVLTGFNLQDKALYKEAKYKLELKR